VSMRDRTPAQPVGEAPCPTCGLAVNVFRYRERSGRPSMFKGKFYADCPNHGRAVDAYRPATQEHVITQGRLWEESPRPALQPAASRPEPVGRPAPNQPELVTQPAAKRSQPALRPAPNRPGLEERSAPPRSEGWGWNLWDWWDKVL